MNTKIKALEINKFWEKINNHRIQTGQPPLPDVSDEQRKAIYYSWTGIIKEALEVSYSGILETIEARMKLYDLIEKYLSSEQSDKTFNDVYEAGHDENDNVIPGSAWEVLETRAKEEFEAQAIDNYIAKRADGLFYPLDKPNTVLFSQAEPLEESMVIDTRSGQEKEEDQSNYALTGKTPKPPVTIKIPVIPDEVQASLPETIRAGLRSLDNFDKRVLIACEALYASGNEIISMTQIYHHAFADTNKRPSIDQISRIRDSVLKMSFIKISIDDKHEAIRRNRDTYNVDTFELLPGYMRDVRATINGQLVKSVFVPRGHVGIFEYSKRTKEFTTIPVKLLTGSGIKHSAFNIALEDYFIRRISRAKKEKQTSVKIRLNTLYERTNANRDQRRRSKNIIIQILDYFSDFQKSSNENYISGYVLWPDNVTIYFDPVEYNNAIKALDKQLKALRISKENIFYH